MNSLKTKCLRLDFEKFILLQIYLACDTMLENEQYKKHIDTAISTIGCLESELQMWLINVLLQWHFVF